MVIVVPIPSVLSITPCVSMVVIGLNNKYSEFRSIRRELTKWADIVKNLNIRLSNE